MKKEDIPFLVDLWYKLDVMRYADEFPKLRGWTKCTDKEKAWKKYESKRLLHGNDYTQLIIRRKDYTKIGESFYAPLDEEYSFYGWNKPKDKKVLMGDIKLLPQYWNKGIGTEGMRKVVVFAFQNTDCDFFVVPPHKKNIAAKRVYEKAGFVVLEDVDNSCDYILMKLDRKEYNRLYKD